MHNVAPGRPWPGAPKPSDSGATAQDTREISRIWQGFMTARFTLGLVLVALQGTLYATGTVQNRWLLAVSLAYFASTLTTGLFGTPRFLGSTFNRPWIGLVGVVRCDLLHNDFHAACFCGGPIGKCLLRFFEFHFIFCNTQGFQCVTHGKSTLLCEFGIQSRVARCVMKTTDEHSFTSGNCLD